MVLPKRKKNRLRGFDYSSSGAYFITVCVNERQSLLSKIVGDGIPDIPENKLTAYGKTAEKHLNNMASFYHGIHIDKYIIMPNHIHMLLSVHGAPGTAHPTNSAVAGFVGTFKRLCNKEYKRNIWQRSYHDHIIRGDDDYAKISDYIDTNVIRWKSDCFYQEKQQ